VSNVRYLCVFTYSGVKHILCCVVILLVFILCLVNPMRVSLDCPFVIVTSVFSNMQYLVVNFIDT
jgi:hypothetical protein